MIFEEYNEQKAMEAAKEHAEKAKFVDGDLSEFEEYLANRNL